MPGAICSSSSFASSQSPSPSQPWAAARWRWSFRLKFISRFDGGGSAELLGHSHARPPPISPCRQCKRHYADENKLRRKQPETALVKNARQGVARGNYTHGDLSPRFVMLVSRAALYLSMSTANAEPKEQSAAAPARGCVKTQFPTIESASSFHQSSLYLKIDR